MRPPEERVNPDDPSGTKRTEDRRAKEMEDDLEYRGNEILRLVIQMKITDYLDISRVVDSQMADYSQASKVKVLAWLEDTTRSANARADALSTGRSVQAVLKLGPRGLSYDQRRVLDVTVGSRIDGLAQDARTKLITTIGDGISQGKDMKTVTREVRDALSVTKARASTIARTETLSVHNKATLDSYKRNEVGRVKWLATPDERTCKYCGMMEGTEYDVEDAPDLPAHPNCRCQLIPIIQTPTLRR